MIVGGRASAPSQLSLILTHKKNVPGYRGPCITTPIISKQQSEDDRQDGCHCLTNLTYEVQSGTARFTYCIDP